ncbi:LANO_0B00892g1_1 [Lachancea nothofagi CBS 11611]|uniref:Altered inheritance of mitochondria protein 18, mitochondrial n=1 Tax=Lachancea nothofagi CBS 11611 TaxID=1266666 RepID=A0A1G4IUZ0_9SACH|nr:LANO_0B00892g1_1 [Lachancea nothofagi CBS 11611]
MFNRLSRFSAAQSLRFARSSISKRSFFSQQLLGTQYQKSHKSTYILGAGAAGLGLILWQCQSIRNDAGPTENIDRSVEVDKSVSPFTVTLGPPDYPLTASYNLLGFGPRAVTFVNFKVYALGIYVANEDLPLISKIFNSNYLSKAFLDTDTSKSHSENVENALRDPIKSRALIGNLIDGGVRMAAKITPIRNTDFSHLKEGLIKSILNHPDAKKNQEIVSRGIQELKDAFTRKGFVPKNDDLLIELQINGSLQLSYCSRKNNEKIMLGRVDEPIIGRMLFSQYLSGPKPLSPATRDSFVSKVKTMV